MASDHINYENVAWHKAHPFTAEDEESNKEVIIAKVTAMIVLFSVSTICGLAPFKLSKWFKWGDNQQKTGAGTVISLMLAFGGGVLLSTTFCHLLPDVEENIANLVEAGSLPELSFALAPVLLCSGFFIIYLIEELVHFYLHHREHKLQKRAKTAEEAFERGITARNSILIKEANGDEKSDAMLNGVVSPRLEDITEDEHARKQREMQEHHDRFHHNPDMPHDHIPHFTDDDDSVVASLRGLLIVLALSIHELFEGLAVGLEPTATQVWYMFGAVSAHKYVIAFCIGVELVVNKTKTWLAIVYILIYSVVSALGIAIGTILVNGTNSDDMETVSAIMQGLAAGTLLYVVFFEILCKDKTGLKQFAAVLIGFIFIFVLQILSKSSYLHQICSLFMNKSTFSRVWVTQRVMNHVVNGFLFELPSFHFQAFFIPFLRKNSNNGPVA